MPPDAMSCQRPLLVDHLQFTVEGEPSAQISIEIPAETMARIGTTHPQKVEGKILFLNIEPMGGGHGMRLRQHFGSSILAEDMTACHARSGLFGRLFRWAVCSPHHLASNPNLDLVPLFTVSLELPHHLEFHSALSFLAPFVKFALKVNPRLDALVEVEPLQ